MNIDSSNKHVILLDNNVFFDDGLFVFLETLDFQLKSYTINPNDISILVDQSIYKELLTTKSKDQDSYNRIQGVLSILKVLHLYEDIDTKDFTDFKPFLDLKVALPDYKLSFITNDSQLASKLHQLDHDKVITIERFEDSILVPVELDKIKVDAPKMKSDFVEAFHTSEKDQLIFITKDDEIARVYSEKFGYLELDQNNVMFGGEGKIYRTYENLLVKIYSEEERRYETVKKIQRLIDLDLRNKYIVWPKDIVYNNNEFVGYIMEEIRDAKGLDMYRIYSFLNISYKERFQICIDLLKMIQYLHDRNILIGDLKFDNILITNKTKELYIIDSGSFQVEDYSCGVFNAAYTHGNLKGKNLREVLRTLEEEYFPIYKILFEVLMGKGPFYDFVSGEVGSEVERNFHYPMEYSKSIKDRNNPLFYWVNGDKRLRDAFYDYFANGEILEVKDWIVLLKEILKGAQ
jgi:tRNA A-37 threonylcarbamoyl transferase component Bud32